MEPIEKNKGGRPSKYIPEFDEQARKLALLGATDQELADFFKADVATINRWKKKHKGFCESLKVGKMLADANVADRLYQRAMGFEHEYEEARVVCTGKTGQERVEKITLKKIYPPDTTAGIFWLKNRMKAAWRDKQDIGVEFERMTDEQLDEIIQRLTNKANG